METINTKITAKDYWNDKLRDYEVENIIRFDFQHPISNIKKELYKFQFSYSLYAKLTKLSNNSESLLFIVLLSALNLVIRKISFKNSFYNIVPVIKQQNSDNLLNHFLLYKCSIDDNHSFREILSNTRKEIILSTENQNFALIKLLIKKGLVDENHKPVIDMAVMLSNLHSKDYLNELNINLLFIFNHTGNNIDAEVEYDCSKYSVKTIEALCKGFVNLLDNLINNSDVSIRSINLLKQDEINHIVTALNNKPSNIDNKETVITAFNRTLDLYPERIAVLCDNKKLTYRQLDDYSNRLANFLVENNLKPGDIVAIQMKPSLEFIISLLAVIKIGAIYLPIDHEYPTERINYIIGNSGLQIILTDIADLVTNAAQTILVDINRLMDYSPQKIVSLISPDHTLYILYTSGSTGFPKGISINHKAAVNYINWAITKYSNGKEVCFPLFTSISFDLTVTSIFVPLLSGSRIVIYAGQNQVALLEKIVKDNIVDKIKLTPSHLLFFNRILENSGTKSNIDTIIVGGEDLSYSTAYATSTLFNHEIDIYNEYGPTEATVGCSIYKFNHEEKTLSVPIGKPINNMSIYIIDGNNLLCPVGLIGEIAIGGVGLANGYVANPELTDQKFIKSSFVSNEIIYKSGDFGKWNEAGILEYFGRMDNQIKIRGFRIEIEEIRQHLLTLSQVEDVVIALNITPNNEKELYAYYITNAPVAKELLVSSITDFLPPYMVPSRFIRVDKIPLTNNGKIDYAILRTKSESFDNPANNTLPRTAIEKKIANIWYIILNNDKISIYDSFFNVGGNSIKLLEVVNRIYKEFKVEISVVKMFENHNIYQMGKYLETLVDEVQD